jgi:hypothetical protein
VLLEFGHLGERFAVECQDVHVVTVWRDCDHCSANAIQHMRATRTSQ